MRQDEVVLMSAALLSKHSILTLNLLEFFRAPQQFRPIPINLLLSALQMFFQRSHSGLRLDQLIRKFSFLPVKFTFEVSDDLL